MVIDRVDVGQRAAWGVVQVVVPHRPGSLLGAVLAIDLAQQASCLGVRVDAYPLPDADGILVGEQCAVVPPVVNDGVAGVAVRPSPYFVSQRSTVVAILVAKRVKGSMPFPPSTCQRRCS